MKAVKCTECGANIELSDSAESGVCPYCGARFIKEPDKKVVENNYVINHIDNHIDRAVIKNGDTFEELVLKYESLQKIGDNARAEKIIGQMKDNYPQCGRTYIYSAEILRQKLIELCDKFDAERDEWGEILAKGEYQTVSLAGRLINAINVEFENFLKELENAEKLLTDAEKDEKKTVLKSLREFCDFTKDKISLANIEFKSLYEKNDALKWEQKRGGGKIALVCVGGVAALLLITVLIALL